VTPYPTGADLGVPLATAETAQALGDVADERGRQLAKWGVQSLPEGTGGAWKPAADEARRITDERAKAGVVTWLDVLLEEVFEAAAEDNVIRLREELVQVAAVAVSWVEDLDRMASEDDGTALVRIEAEP
jgi:hypothetical protein